MELARLTTIFDADTRRFDQAAISYERKIKDMGRASGTFGSQLSGINPSLLGLTSGIVGFGAALGTGANAILQYSGRLEQTKIAFTTLTGSAAEASRLLKDIQKLADRSPFEFEDALTAARRFSAMGLAARDVVPLLEDLGNAVAAVGGGTEAINGVSRAIAQIVGKGRVQAEEINQIADATSGAINGFQILAKELGVSQAEVRKLGEQGKLSSDVFLRAFQNFSRQNFAGAMEAQSKTLLGALTTIKDSAKSTLAEGIKPLYEGIRGLAVAMAEASVKGTTFKQTMVAAVAAIANWRASLPEWTRPSGRMPELQLGGEVLKEVQAIGAANQQAELKELSQFVEDFIKQQAALQKALRPGREALQGVESQLRTLGDETVLGAVTEQFRQMRLEMERSAETTPEAIAQFNALERQALAKAREMDARRASMEVAEKERDVISSLNKIYRDLFLGNEQFNLSQERQAVLLSDTAIQATRLTGEARKLAEAQLNLALKEADIREGLNIQTRFIDIFKQQNEQLREGELNATAMNRELSDPKVAWALYNSLKSLLRINATLLDIKDLQGDFLDIGPKLELPAGFGRIPADDIVPDETMRQKWLDAMTEMGRSTEDILVDSFRNVFEDGFMASIGNMLVAFTGMLQEMALRATAARIVDHLFGADRAGGGWLGKLIGWGIGALGGSIGGSLGGASTSGGGAWSAAKGRAAGGPVFAGTPYVVGERGPELFMPGQSGHISPSLAPTIETVVFNVPANTSRAAMSQMMQQLADKLTHAQRRNG